MSAQTWDAPAAHSQTLSFQNSSPSPHPPFLILHFLSAQLLDDQICFSCV